MRGMQTRINRPQQPGPDDPMCLDRQPDDILRSSVIVNLLGRSWSSCLLQIKLTVLNRSGGAHAGDQFVGGGLRWRVHRAPGPPT